MSARHLVSIIICAYNAQEFIEETLESIFAQTYHPTEIIVVDDGSTDETGRIVKAFRQQLRYVWQKNAHSAAARNTGIGVANGEFLCFFDADDIMPPDRITSQVAFMDRYPDLGLTFVDYRNFSQDGQFPLTHFQTCPVLQKVLQGRRHGVLQDARSYLLQENFGITGTMMLRRRMLLKERGFKTSYWGGEDFDFYYRLARHTSVGVLNLVGMLRRIHKGNKSHSLAAEAASLVEIYSNLLRTEESPEARAMIRHNLAISRQSLARISANNGFFMAALNCEFKAIATCGSLRILFQSLKGIVRTLAIATGLHRSTDESGVFSR